MGGKSPPPPKTYSPMEQAQAQMAIDRANAERAEQQAAAERERQAAERANSIMRTTSAADSLVGQGRSFGEQRVGTLGYEDNYGILDNYNRLLQAQRAQVPQISESPGSYFDFNSLFGTAQNQSQAAQQTRLDNEFRNMTPIGWQNNYFSDTSDDAILNAILGEQYGSAFDTIDAARARGQLSSGGFDNTLRQLEQKRHAARAQLEDMGLGVLSKYRDDLTGLSKQYGDQITNYKLGQNLDLSSFQNAAQQRATELGGRMRGDIYRALGDTQLFNTDSLMARGGSMAGVSNNPLRNAFRDPSVNDPTRTTGTTGVF